ncbi:MAG: DUF2007 domain-containing protein [Ignavibacteriales bacterium]|nr:DUF2007 domain-containing protein [Ignavibacteriales bacterium]
MEQQFLPFRKLSDESQLAYIAGVFEAESINYYVADENMSGVLPIPMFSKKIMVAVEDIERANDILRDEELYETELEIEEYEFDLQENEKYALQTFINDVQQTIEPQNEIVISFFDNAEKIFGQLSNGPTLSLTMQDAIELDTMLLWAKENGYSNDALDGIEESLNGFVEELRGKNQEQ